MSIALQLHANDADTADTVDAADTADAAPAFRRIGPAEFAAIVASGVVETVESRGTREGDDSFDTMSMNADATSVTLLDLREPADVAAYPIVGAINAPLDPLAKVLRTVPKTHMVVVYCTEGWWSEEVAEILADRGYDVASLEGGFRAYREYVESHAEPHGLG